MVPKPKKALSWQFLLRDRKSGVYAAVKSSIRALRGVAIPAPDRLVGAVKPERRQM
jgi:hypothetical protein